MSTNRGYSLKILRRVTSALGLECAVTTAKRCAESAQKCSFFSRHKISGPQKGPAERGHAKSRPKVVKKCQKYFRHLSAFSAQGKKTSEIVKKCQKDFRHFLTIFARHLFCGPFQGALTKRQEHGAQEVKNYGGSKIRFERRSIFGTEGPLGMGGGGGSKNTTRLLRSRLPGKEPKTPWTPKIRKNYEKNTKSPTQGGA